MEKNSKIFIAGATGMVGSAIKRKLEEEGYTNVNTWVGGRIDFTDQVATNTFFNSHRPEYVFLCAAKVGGIKANSDYKADFIYQNLMIEANIIKASHEVGVKKLLFMGSSCIYPKACPQPIKEEYLLSGYLEPTNDAYAIAKIAGIKLCDSFREQFGDNFFSVMPCNLYGPNDNYNLDTSHVIPALIQKFKGGNFTIWGDGTALREFMHVDDLANACILLMTTYNDGGHINIGTGDEYSIEDLALLLRKVMGLGNTLVFDKTRPNGTVRKVMDSSKIRKLGWIPKYNLEQGLKTIL